MSRYTGPKCKLCKKYEERLYLKGDRCYSDKCPMSAPQTKRKFRRQASEFARHLLAKQKARIMFNVGEKHLRKVFHDISRRKGLKGENLLKALSMRLDNVTYRLGFASSLQQARQTVNLGHVILNGRKCGIPSKELSSGDVVTLSEKGKKLESVKKALEHADVRAVPEWLKFEKAKLSGRVEREPDGEDLQQLGIDHRLIVEYYSR